MNSLRIRRVTWVMLVAGVVVGAYLLGRRDPADGLSEPADRTVGQGAGPGVSGHNSPMVEPTAPAVLKRPIMPWEPHRALVVAMVPEFLRADSRRFDVYWDIIRAAAAFVDVIVMLPEERSDVESRLLDLLSRDPADAAVARRVHFLTSSITSGWVRDYLPQYALDKTGRLALLDARTIDLTSEPSLYLRGLAAKRDGAAPGFTEHLAELLGDDISPAYLGSFLRSEFGYAIRMVRPPVALAGGDFVPLSRDDVAVSESTLRYHGGQDDVFRSLIRQYFGVRRVHILPTLPGRTVDHLDFIMQGVGDNVMLVARPPQLPPMKQLYATMIGERAIAVIQRNLDYLRRNFPQHRLIEVPMPPPISAAPEEIRGEIRSMIETQICERFGIDLAAFHLPPADPLRLQAEDALKKILIQKLGVADLERPDDLNRAAQAVMGDSLATLERLHVDNFSVYRTYLNSTVIHAPDGRTLVLLPRYAPRNQAETAMFPLLEQQVLAAYREALPGAQLHWIDCDAIIEELGAVHCITHLVPWIEPLPDDPAK